MNERICKLANEARTEVYQRIGYNDRDREIAFEQTFAELLVKECMNVARQQRTPANLNYKPSERFVEDLKQHFGVEE